MTQDERERHLPSLVELPFASACEHEQIVYYHARVTWPGAELKVRRVHLRKAQRLIEFDVWEPVSFYHKTSAGTRPVQPLLDDAEEAVLQAYSKLTDQQRGLVGVDPDKPDAVDYDKHERLSVYVILADVRFQFWVLLEHTVYRYVQDVWEDQEGRVW